MSLDLVSTRVVPVARISLLNRNMPADSSPGTFDETPRELSAFLALCSRARLLPVCGLRWPMLEITSGKQIS